VDVHIAIGLLGHTIYLLGYILLAHQALYFSINRAHM